MKEHTEYSNKLLLQNVSCVFKFPIIQVPMSEGLSNEQENNCSFKKQNKIGFC